VNANAVKKICAMAHAKGVDVMVDGAHAFAQLDYRIPDLDCDYYGASLHKWLGAPLGTGILYVRRDKVSLVVFSGRSARVVLQPTSSVDLAEERLQRLAVGGTTPLTHGLVAGLKVVRSERLRDASVYPLMVLISDGRGNISLFGEEPLLEAQRLATQIGVEKVRMLVIDSARDHIAATPLARVGIGGPTQPARSPLFSGGYGFNACLDLAERAGGEYLGLYDLSQGAILAGVEKSLRGR